MRLAVLLILLCGALTAVAETPSAAAILKRGIEADKLNAAKAAQYTYVEEIQHIHRDKNGNIKETRSETFDVIFIEGQPYKKLILVNGKPLDAKLQKKVDADVAKTRQERLAQRRGLMSFSITRQIQFGDLQTVIDLFDSRVAGEDTVNGRTVWVVDSAPKPGVKPRNKAEADAVHVRRQYWFDKEEGVLLKSDHVVLDLHNNMQPGTEFVQEFGKVNDCWQTMRMTIKGELYLYKMIHAPVETVQTYRDYKKFDVQSTVTAIGEIKP